MKFFKHTITTHSAVFWIFQLVRSVRYGVLMSVFGYVSHCQQTPSCGSFFMQNLKEKGMIRACIETTPRFISCGLVKHSPSIS